MAEPSQTARSAAIRPNARSAAKLVSQLLGPFRLMNLLGVGGQAAVYLAREERSGVKVALKVFPRSAPGDMREARLLREAKIAATLDHPNILKMLAIDSNAEWNWVAMEYCDGGSLATEIKQRGVLSPERTRQALEQVSAALHCAHQHQLIHRDVKPANVLLFGDVRDGPGQLMKLADFGLASVSSASSGNRRAAGTPYFLSPEVWLGQSSSVASDIYALGVSAYILLTGQYPFDASSREELAQLHVQAPVPDLKQYRCDIPAELEGMVLKCLAKDPKDRWSNAAELSSMARRLGRLSSTSRVGTGSSSAIRVVQAKAFDTRNRAGNKTSAISDQIERSPADALKVLSGDQPSSVIGRLPPPLTGAASARSHTENESISVSMMELISASQQRHNESDAGLSSMSMSGLSRSTTKIEPVEAGSGRAAALSRKQKAHKQLWLLVGGAFALVILLAVVLGIALN